MDEKEKKDEKRVLLVRKSAEDNQGKLKAVTEMDDNGNVLTVEPVSSDLAELFDGIQTGLLWERFSRSFWNTLKSLLKTRISEIFIMSESVIDRLIKIDLDITFLYLKWWQAVIFNVCSALQIFSTGFVPRLIPIWLRTVTLHIRKNFTVPISPDEYLHRFRDADRFIGHYHACPNYNRNWTCLLFSRDLDRQLHGYHNLLIINEKTTPIRSDLPFSESRRLIHRESKRLEHRLHEMEPFR